VPRSTYKRRRGNVYFKALRRAAGILLALLLLVSLPAVALRWIAPPVSAFMLQYQSANGTPYVYEWRDWNRLGSAAPLAVMAAEDQKFPQHHGFDLASIRDAVAAHLHGDSLRGASTISQQVAKNLFLWPGRSLVRKLIEAWFTGVIELSWPKQRILEVYLNIAEFGPGLYGVWTATARYYGRPPDLVSLEEAARLAAVLPSPGRLDPTRDSAYLAERAAWIVEQVRGLGGPAYLANLDRPR